MTRFASTLVLAFFVLGCQRGKEQAVFIQPSLAPPYKDSVPADPFGSPDPAYTRLSEVADASFAKNWDGTLESFGPWLEDQTVAVERVLALLKAIRVGPRDVYAVANGRIAMLYDHIALALTQASKAAVDAGLDADWRGQEGRIWEQSAAFWGRCVRDCASGGTHLDAWELHCRAKLANSQAKLEP